MNTTMPRSVIHLATDHAGFALKEEIKSFLIEQGYSTVDHGAHHYDAEDDFPDFIGLAALAVSQSPQQNRAIIFGGSGQGEAMLANRYPGVRATVMYSYNEDIITISREHNDANVLSIGARFLEAATVKMIITKWLTAPHSSEEKYRRRNQKIETLTRGINRL